MNWQDENADEEWVDDDETDSDSDLMQCPACLQPVHEDTQQCPHCREWITPQYPGGHGQRIIWLVAAILLILVISGVMLL